MNEQMYAHDLNYDAYYLEHHGIKGQKWGVRRFQNLDGTLTNAGKKHKTGSGIVSENRTNPLDKIPGVKKDGYSKSRLGNSVKKDGYSKSPDPRKSLDKFKNQMKKDPKTQAATAAATLATISVAQSIKNARVAEALMGVKLARNQIVSKTAVQAGKVAAAAALSVIGAHMIHDYMKDKNESKQKK